jgi:2-C-methyl-D-erythritol 4-phosphate cytidylyltransferase
MPTPREEFDSNACGSTPANATSQSHPAVAFAAAVVVAAGRGVRFGDSDKILLPLRGRPLLAYCLDALEAAWTVSEVILVVGEHTTRRVTGLVDAGYWSKITRVVIGGTRRQDSVANGVNEVDSAREVVVIHDAARPLATPSLFDQTAIRARTAGAAITAMPITDTIKRVEECLIRSTVARDGLWAAQTPQAFQRALLARALSSPWAKDTTYTDEAALFEALGIPVEVVPGHVSNLKLTRAEDASCIEAMLAFPDRGSNDIAPRVVRG